MIQTRLGIGLALLVATCGCSTNMFNRGAQGAATGALGASFVGAMTDLIVDGRVNTYTLTRNAVGGAIAGGMTGAAVGHREDQRAEAARTQPPPGEQPDQDLEKRIGKDNYQAALDLVYKRHNDAYRKTLKSAKSKNAAYKTAALAIQALVDTDRKNPEGVTDALEALVAQDDQIGDMKQAKKTLDELYNYLKEERKIRGVR